MDIIIYAAKPYSSSQMRFIFSQLIEEIKKAHDFRLKAQGTRIDVEGAELKFTVHLVDTVQNFEAIYRQCGEQASLLYMGTQDPVTLETLFRVPLRGIRHLIPTTAVSEAPALCKPFLLEHVHRSLQLIASTPRPPRSAVEQQQDWIRKLENACESLQIKIIALNQMIEIGTAPEGTAMKVARKQRHLKHFLRLLEVANEKRLELMTEAALNDLLAAPAVTPPTVVTPQRVSQTQTNFFTQATTPAKEANLAKALLGFIKTRMTADNGIQVHYTAEEIKTWLLFEIELELLAHCRQNLQACLDEHKEKLGDTTKITECIQSLAWYCEAMRTSAKKLKPASLFAATDGVQHELVAAAEAATYQSVLLEMAQRVLEQPTTPHCLDAAAADNCLLGLRETRHDVMVAEIQMVIEEELASLVRGAKALTRALDKKFKPINEAYGPILGEANFDFMPTDEAAQKEFFAKVLADLTQREVCPVVCDSKAQIISPSTLLRRLLDKDDVFFKGLHQSPDLIAGFSQFRETPIDSESVVIRTAPKADSPRVNIDSFFDELGRNTRALMKK